MTPKELENAFKQSAELKICFEKLTYGKQREYTEYIGEAKKEETRQRRLEKSIPMILTGISLNDKYRR